MTCAPEGVGNTRFDFRSKGLAREVLRGQLGEISTIARTLAYKIPGIDLVFHIPANLPDAALLALAQAFAAQAVQYEAQFIRRGLDSKFILNLQTAVTSFEATLTPAEASQDEQVEATAQLSEAVRRGMIARNILKGILKIKYKNKPARMSAWQSANHLKRTDKPEPEPTPVG